MLSKIWKKWKAFGLFLGNLLARIVLTVFYFTVFLPFGFFTTVFGDRLGIKSVPDNLWQPRDEQAEDLASAKKQG